MMGMYGAIPGPVNEELRQQIIGMEKPITDRPADHISPELPKAKNEIGMYTQKPEDVLSYALLPQVVKSFLEGRYAAAGSCR